MKNRYLIVSGAEYTDHTGILENPDGEFGGEGSIEMKDQHELVLGTYEGETAEEAIGICVAKYEVSPEVLTAYELMPPMSPLVYAIAVEIKYLLEAYDEEYKDKKGVICDNLIGISTIIADNLESFVGDIRELLDLELEDSYYK